MAEFLLSDVVGAVGGSTEYKGDFLLNGVSTDTRTVKAGELFIALKGANFDGHNYVEAAVVKGAAALIVSCEINLTSMVPIIRVGDTKTALQALAQFYRRRFSIPVVAVTGSNGKTTTKDMIAAVLSTRFSVLKTQANFNNEIGLSQTLLRLDATHQAAVVELGMRGIGQIEELSKIALPTIGVVTMVGETHIELLGTVEQIASAKAELVRNIDNQGLVILNGDDPQVRLMAEQTEAKVRYFGLNDADVVAKNINLNAHGITFDCCYADICVSIKVAAVGRHNVYNALAAVAVGHELGLEPAEIAAGLALFVPDAMRLSVTNIGVYTVINDAYNASPHSMVAAIEALRTVAKERTIVVFGDMLELGQVAVMAHEQIGRQLIEHNIDITITVGALAKVAADYITSDGGNAIACRDHSEARAVLASVLQAGDTILLKGSRGMKMEQLLDVFMDNPS